MFDFAKSAICGLIRDYISEIRVSIYNGRNIAAAILFLTKLEYVLNMIKDDSISTNKDKSDILKIFDSEEISIIENYIKAVDLIEDKEDFKQKTLICVEILLLCISAIKKLLPQKEKSGNLFFKLRLSLAHKEIYYNHHVPDIMFNHNADTVKEYLDKECGVGVFMRSHPCLAKKYRCFWIQLEDIYGLSCGWNR